MLGNWLDWPLAKQLWGEATTIHSVPYIRIECCFSLIPNKIDWNWYNCTNWTIINEIDQKLIDNHKEPGHQFWSISNMNRLIIINVYWFWSIFIECWYYQCVTSYRCILILLGKYKVLFSYIDSLFLWGLHNVQSTLSHHPRNSFALPLFFLQSLSQTGNIMVL